MVWSALGCHPLLDPLLFAPSEAYLGRSGAVPFPRLAWGVPSSQLQLDQRSSWDQRGLECPPVGPAFVADFAARSQGAAAVPPKEGEGEKGFLPLASYPLDERFPPAPFSRSESLRLYSIFSCYTTTVTFFLPTFYIFLFITGRLSNHYTTRMALV